VSVGTATGEIRYARARVDSAVAAVAALTLLGAVLRFTRLGHQGMWFDEANTAADLHYPLGKMLGLLPQNETTPPLFYVVGWFWARVFGFGSAALRSLPAVCGVLAIPVAYATGAKLISRRAGVVVAALTACNPLLIWYSQEFRPYAPLVLLSGAGLLAFLYAREDPTPRRLAIWAVASALALATHYYALLLVVPEAVWLLALHPRRRALLFAVAGIAACGLALLPLAIAQNHTGNASWIARIPFVSRLRQILPEFLIGFQAPAQDVLEPVAAAIAILALVLLAARADAIERRGALTAGALALAGIVINLALVAVGIDDLITRNVLALWLPAALLVTGGLGARRAGLVGVGATAALCAIGIVGAVGVAVERNFQRPDWRVVARLLGERPAAAVGARVILVQRYRDLLPLSLYLPGTGFFRTLPVREVDVVSITAPHVPLCWWGAACNLAQSPMQASYPIPGFHEVWRRGAYQFTVVRLASEAPVLLTRRMIGDALTATSLRHDVLITQR
jgi:hypothetical protein